MLSGFIRNVFQDNLTSDSCILNLFIKDLIINHLLKKLHY
jgi:hypothetical protein